MKKSLSLWLLSFACLTLILLLPEIAQAAPGGIVKAAARTGLGKAMIFGALLLLFLPVIIYQLVMSAQRTQRVHRELALLAQTQPQYGWFDVNDRAREIFYWVWAAWKEGKMSQAANFTTPWYWQNQQHILDEWASQGLENVCRLQEISDIRPIFVHHALGGEGSRLVVAIDAKVVDYLKNTETGEVVKGDTKEGDLQTVWTLKFEGGAWKLNLIEPGEKEWTYLKMPAQIPAELLPQKA